MDRLVLTIVLVLVALGVAALIRRRRPESPVATGGHVPAQLDRADFAAPDVAWLVAVFTSSTCATCAEVWDRAKTAEGPEVVAQQLDVAVAPDLHDRYRIDAVPLALVADRAGVVRASFLGPIGVGELEATIARLVHPG